ncbi:hypothetical protein G6F24_016507 [Rhizopus arrhizus]|nr:hypothetical protein G6F24_016507 [Rhizopus arrhizus]
MFSGIPSKASILKPHHPLVGLDAVVERGHIEAEFLGQVEHGGHLVGAVAVDVHADVALDGAGQRVQLEVALAAGIPGAVALVAAAPALARGRLGRVLGDVVGGIDEGRTIAGHTRLGFSPQAIFRTHGAPGNFIAW